MLEFLAARADGDARTALGALEVACETAGDTRSRSRTPRTRCSARPCSTTRRRPPLRHDLGLDQVDARLGPRGVAALPRGDARGRRGRALHRRAGWSSSPARTSATPTRRRWRRRPPPRRPSSTSGMPEATLNLAQAAVYLALAPKSNAPARRSAARAPGCASTARPRSRSHLRYPGHPGERELGHGVGYDYPHDRPNASRDQEYMPEERRGRALPRADEVRPRRRAARALRTHPQGPQAFLKTNLAPSLGSADSAVAVDRDGGEVPAAHPRRRASGQLGSDIPDFGAFTR